MKEINQINLSIVFSLAGDESIASTRIRYFSMIRCMENRKIRFTSDTSLSSILKSNVFFVQKRVDQKILNLARISKLAGKRIIYDVDDFGYALRYWAQPDLFRKMIEIADVLTVGSESQKQIFLNLFRKENIIVLPPIIDYYPNYYVINDSQSEEILRIVWFGNSYNFAIFEKYISGLLSIPKIKLIVVTDKKELGHLTQRYPLIQFEGWSLSNFVSILRSCDLSVLTHDGSDYDQVKTNNKMITSISWGVPAIVSNTQEYRFTAQKAGIQYAIFSNSEELNASVERLRSPDARKSYLEKAQPIIWKDHSPDAITDYFLNLCIAIIPKNFMKRVQEVISSHRN